MYHVYVSTIIYCLQYVAGNMMVYSTIQWILILYCIWMISCGSSTRTSTIRSIGSDVHTDHTTNDTLHTVNHELIELYSMNKHKMLHRLITYNDIDVVVVDERITLYKHTLAQPVYTSHTINTISTKLKYINHLPLNVLIRLQPSIAGNRINDHTDRMVSITEDNIKQLNEYQAALHNLDIDSFISRINSTDIHELQPHIVHIYDTTLQFVQQLTNTNTVTMDQLYDYCATISGSVDELTYHASKSILYSIHDIMNELFYSSNNKKLLDIDELDKLYVLCNIGSHMARSGDVHSTYFKQLFDLHLKKQPQSNPIHVIYNEYDSMSNNGFDSLSLHLIDGMVSQLMYNDARRLHRDVMSDATQQIINELLPQHNYIVQVYHTYQSILPLLIGLCVMIFSYMYVQNSFVHGQQHRQLPAASHQPQ